MSLRRNHEPELEWACSPSHLDTEIVFARERKWIALASARQSRRQPYGESMLQHKGSEDAKVRAIETCVPVLLPNFRAAVCSVEHRARASWAFAIEIKRAEVWGSLSDAGKRRATGENIDMIQRLIDSDAPAQACS
ncbi:hypothetical protein DENSPDRAFT_836595 [Dentipellis sp. KUC8613]|nr:hypothetical protein DENSPDRAFT_836595 [Dentipellis sp. KUC8613]